jgi:hypothetical protein
MRKKGAGSEKKKLQISISVIYGPNSHKSDFMVVTNCVLNVNQEQVPTCNCGQIQLPVLVKHCKVTLVCYFTMLLLLKLFIFFDNNNVEGSKKAFDHSKYSIFCQ